MCFLVDRAVWADPSKSAKWQWPLAKRTTVVVVVAAVDTTQRHLPAIHPIESYDTQSIDRADWVPMFWKASNFPSDPPSVCEETAKAIVSSSVSARRRVCKTPSNAFPRPTIAAVVVAVLDE